MDNVKIGLFLKELRTKEGYSQRDVAGKCNVSHQAVSKWEKGESIPDISALKSLASLYAISIDELLEGERDPSKQEHKPYNNFNKEIIKITLSLFIPLVGFLPFHSVGADSYTGFELMIMRDFGLGIITFVTILTFVGFQILFSIFTILRIISFSRNNVYLNRSLSVLVLVLVWFTISISALNPFPFVILFVYLGSIYVVSTRVLHQMKDVQ